MEMRKQRRKTGFAAPIFSYRGAQPIKREVTGIVAVIEKMVASDQADVRLSVGSDLRSVTDKRLSRSLDFLIGDNDLYSFDELRNQGKFFRVSVPCNTDLPQRFLPAQLVESYSRHFES